MKYNIDGKYPMMMNCLLVNEMDNGMYCVNNVLTNETYELDYNTYHFLRNLNGNRNPYKLARKYRVDADELMDYFDANLLIRTNGRTLFSCEGTILRTIYIPKKNRSKSIIPKIYNCILCIGWLPMLLYGLYRVLFTTYKFSSDYLLLGYIVAIVVGVILHEISHAMACLANGGEFFEVGVMWEKFYPGAYVLIDKRKIRTKMQRVQVDAAGVEMNFMLAGLFFVLCTVIEGLNGFFLYAAIINVILAVFNITFLDGLDGGLIIGELIGLRNGVDGAKSFLGKCIKTKHLKTMSANEKVACLACVIILLYQILLPVVIINNVLSLIGGFL